ncbi:hypothetical protein SAMN05444172_2584 [Burkholderia sp. GAS332]|nr:hypothetical protein SAMN05444172_2584 [Burkholderia sp. GAS332]
MKSPDTQQREAIQSLQRNGAAWQLFVAWLDQNCARVERECANADDDIHVRRAQGEARCLREIVSAVTPKP